MKNKEIKKNTNNSNFYEGVDDKGCRFSFNQTDTGSEEDKKWWGEQVSWHGEQVAEHDRLVAQGSHSQTITFTHRQNKGEKIIENTRVFEVPSSRENSSAKITEISDDKLIDNGEKSPSSVKRQRTDDEGSYSVREKDKTKRNREASKDEKQTQNQNSQPRNKSITDKSLGKVEKQSEGSVVEQAPKQGKDKKNIGEGKLLALGGGFVALITAFGIKVFRR